MNMTPSSNGINFTRAITILWREKVKFLLISAIVVSVFIAVSPVILKEKYQAQSIIKLMYNNTSGTTEERERGINEIILSRTVLSRVVKQLNLTEDTRPEWLKEIFTKKPTVDQRIYELNRDIHVIALDPDDIHGTPSSLFAIRVEGKSPQRNSSVVNAITDAFVERRAELIYMGRENIIHELSAQVDDLQSQLKVAEEKIALFKKQKVVIPLSDRTAEEMLSTIRANIIDAETRLIEAKVRQDNIQQTVKNELEIFQTKFTEEHPLIIRIKHLEESMKGSTRNVISSLAYVDPLGEEVRGFNDLRTDYDAAVAQYQAAKQQIALLKTELNALNNRSDIQKQIDTLLAHRDSIRERYVQLRGQLNEQQVLLSTEHGASGRVQIIERAEPSTIPVGLSFKKMIALGIVFCVAFIGIAIVMHRLFKEYSAAKQTPPTPKSEDKKAEQVKQLLKSKNDQISKLKQQRDIAVLNAINPEKLKGVSLEEVDLNQLTAKECLQYLKIMRPRA